MVAMASSVVEYFNNDSFLFSCRQDARCARIRGFRVGLPADFRFDRLDANARLGAWRQSAGG